MFPFLKKHKIKVSLIGIFIFILLYYSSGYFFVYNNDAYINAHTIQVASIVSGKVDQVYVHDNQHVAQDSKLFSLEIAPFLLVVRKEKAIMEQKEAQLEALASTINEAVVEVEGKKAFLDNQVSEWSQAQQLYKEKNLSLRVYQNTKSKYEVAKADYEKAKSALVQVKVQEKVLQAEIKNQQASLEIAKYNLHNSTYYAPTNGFINNLQLYPGDYATAGKPVFGFIDNDSWYITANIKENNLPIVSVGRRLWVYLANRPWHLYRGEVMSVGRGVSRTNATVQSALPYVKPVTSWIRYPYRIPVRIRLLNFPHNIPMQVGIDAKVIIF